MRPFSGYGACRASLGPAGYAFGKPHYKSEAGRDKPAHDKSLHRRYDPIMTIEDLEKAVAKLPPDELAKFRDWFEAFDGARLDEKIERDAKAGRLDRLAEQALTAQAQRRNAAVKP